MKSYLLYRVAASFPLLPFLAAVFFCRRFPLISLPLRWWRALAALATALLLAIALSYLVLPLISDESEAQVMCTAFRILAGAPVYPSLNGAAQYGVLYGPVAFLSLVPAYLVLGGSLFAAKFSGVLAFLATLGLAWRLSRLFGGRAEALLAAGGVSLFVLRFGFIGFWAHPDPLLCLAAALPLWAALRRGPLAAAVIAALCLAVALNLKVTGFLYVVPALVLLFARHGARAAALSAGFGAALMLLPFLLPQVSFADYAALLRVVSRHGLDPELISRDFQDAVLLTAPLLALLWHGKRRSFDALPRPSRFYLAALGAAMGAVCVLAAKPGSGPHHLLPFAAPVALAYFLVRPQAAVAEPDAPFARVALPLACTLAFYSIGSFTGSVGIAATFRSLPASLAAQRDLRVASQTFGRAVEMGTGVELYDRRTVLRPLLVFAGNPYTIDRNSLNDTGFSGLPLPRATREYMDRCGTPFWLIPAGAGPFLSPNGYRPEVPVFDADFRLRFMQHYEMRMRLPNYDVWGCREHFPAD